MATTTVSSAQKKQPPWPILHGDDCATVRGREYSKDRAKATLTLYVVGSDFIAQAFFCSDTFAAIPHYTSKTETPVRTVGKSPSRCNAGILVLILRAGIVV